MLTEKQAIVIEKSDSNTSEEEKVSIEKFRSEIIDSITSNNFDKALEILTKIDDGDFGKNFMGFFSLMSEIETGNLLVSEKLLHLLWTIQYH